MKRTCANSISLEDATKMMKTADLHIPEFVESSNNLDPQLITKKDVAGNVGSFTLSDAETLLKTEHALTRNAIFFHLTRTKMVQAVRHPNKKFEKQSSEKFYP